MKKLKSAIVLLIALCITCSSFGVSAATFTPSESSLKSTAVYFVNTDTNTVVFKQNEHKKLYPASFVKVMVALMVLEKYPDPKKIKITAPSYIFDELYGKNASTADIRQNEKLSMLDLLYAMLLPSACEAASIIADYMGDGSIPDFVEAMNKRAMKLGCNDTTFMNAHGLHDSEQLTSAYDMYLITKQALKIPLFKKISTTYQYQMSKTNKHPEKRTIFHTNEMMRSSSTYYFPYVTGIKTGTTDESGKNLVSIGSKEGYNYIAVTMGAATKRANGSSISENLCQLDNIKLYSWAFDNFAVKTVIKRNESVADVKVKLSWDSDHVLLAPKQDVTALLKDDVDISSVQRIPNVPDEINAPIKKGDKIGTLILKLADSKIGEVDLVSTKDVSSTGILSVFGVIQDFFSSIVFKIIIAILILFLIFYIVVVILYNRRRKNRRLPPKRPDIKMKRR